MLSQEYLSNNAAFRRMEQEIKRAYPHGHFVAITDEKIVGDSAEFMALRNALIAGGRDPRRVIIVQAGFEYPEKVTILGSWVPGFPLLRMFECGNDAEFWIQRRS